VDRRVQPTASCLPTPACSGACNDILFHINFEKANPRLCRAVTDMHQCKYLDMHPSRLARSGALMPPRRFREYATAFQRRPTTPALLLSPPRWLCPPAAACCCRRRRRRRRSTASAVTDGSSKQPSGSHMSRVDVRLDCLECKALDPAKVWRPRPERASKYCVMLARVLTGPTLATT
jgi:hypothetical protein